MSNSETPRTAASQASLSFTISWNLLRFMAIELVMLFSHFTLATLFSFLLQSFPASGSFSMSQIITSGGQSLSFIFMSHYNKYSGLISFRIDWFDLLGVHGMLKSLLQHHSKASVLHCSAYFMVQLSHPYITTGKTIALTTQTFFRKVLSLLFNMLSRYVLAFLPRSHRLLISWLPWS